MEPFGRTAFACTPRRPRPRGRPRTDSRSPHFGTPRELGRGTTGGTRRTPPRRAARGAGGGRRRSGSAGRRRRAYQPHRRAAGYGVRSAARPGRGGRSSARRRRSGTGPAPIRRLRRPPPGPGTTPPPRRRRSRAGAVPTTRAVGGGSATGPGWFSRSRRAIPRKLGAASPRPSRREGTSRSTPECARGGGTPAVPRGRRRPPRYSERVRLRHSVAP
mmetsp:Transcript_54120/g.162005  ORF Transcript_54120/g.162005 Transcript_54120/m.162005 type:complete len:217 (-) Transcript_54120:246-896(-)